jgi:hypothetical protein
VPPIIIALLVKLILLLGIYSRYVLEMSATVSSTRSESSHSVHGSFVSFPFHENIQIALKIHCDMVVGKLNIQPIQVFVGSMYDQTQTHTYTYRKDMVCSQGLLKDS